MDDALETVLKDIIQDDGLHQFAWQVLGGPGSEPFRPVTLAEIEYTFGVDHADVEAALRKLDDPFLAARGGALRKPRSQPGCRRVEPTGSAEGGFV